MARKLTLTPDDFEPGKTYVGDGTGTWEELDRAKLHQQDDEKTHRGELWRIAVEANARARRARIDAYLAKRKIRRQQAGNNERRAVDDGWIEDASRRHLAGEKWDAIAESYGISSSRLRAHVKRRGLPTRGHR